MWATELSHLEFWVGNALQAAHYYRHVFGFDIVARASDKIRRQGRESFLIRQGRVALLLTSATSTTGAVHQYVSRHGDSVREIAFRTEDIEKWVQHANSTRDASGLTTGCKCASVAAFGETRISFSERSLSDSIPEDFDHFDGPGESVGITGVDHVVVNVEDGRLAPSQRWCEEVLGSEPIQFFERDAVSTEKSGLRSVVLATTSDLKVNINEPTPGVYRSHIQEYLDSHGGPGVQHIALATGDAISTVSDLRSRGVTFHRPSKAYYAELWAEPVPSLGQSRAEIERAGVLLDYDVDGYLIQQFSEHVQPRPTVFFEIIERVGSRGFGERTFRTHFKEMEDAALRRGYE